jgi:hypothetical protein
MNDKPDPAFPIPVARLIIPNAGGDVLILRRAGSTHAAGSWCLPSLTCDSLRFLFYQDSLPPVPGTMHCINLYFECAVSGQIELNDESSQYTWVSPTDLEKFSLVFRNDEALRLYWEERGRL